MTMPIDLLREIVENLKDLIAEADDRGCEEVKTTCNTYGLYNFICAGSYGYLDLDKDIDDLLVDPDNEDED